MPGPCSKPNGTEHTAAPMEPAKLRARIADWEKTQAENKNSKLSFRKPGSQKK